MWERCFVHPTLKAELGLWFKAADVHQLSTSADCNSALVQQIKILQSPRDAATHKLNGIFDSLGFLYNTCKMQLYLKSKLFEDICIL